MNSSSILKCNCSDIGTPYDMPLLKVIERQPVRPESEIEIKFDNSAADDVGSLFEDHKSKAYDIINKAQQDADAILADAKKKANEILAKAKGDSQKIYLENYREAQEKGYCEGAEKAKLRSQKQIDEITEELKSISDILAEEKKAIINGSKNIIIDLAAEIAKKIVNENFVNENSGVFAAVFQNAVRNIPPAEKLILTVSDKDYKIMTYDAQKLLRLAPGFKNIEIRCDTSAESGTLRLESSIMVVDASVGSQISLLKKEVSGLL